MTDELYLNNERLHFVQGFPSLFLSYALPNAELRHASGWWGTVCVQELRGKSFLIRHFIFSLTKLLRFDTRENNEGLQALISLKGGFKYNLKGLALLELNEKEFHLLNAHEQLGSIEIGSNKTCSLMATYYASPLYESIVPSFQSFKKQLKKASKKAYVFTKASITARFTVHDAIQAIWLDRYAPGVEKKFIEMKLQAKLFTLLAQTYTAPIHEAITAQERDQACAARTIILQNIKKHLTPEEIALQLYCSPSWLKKAFSKAYGMGMFHFLRQHRMLLAKELLLKGESLKAVAIEVGMKPRNFPKEFKSFFGYTVTELKKRLR